MADAIVSAVGRVSSLRARNKPKGFTGTSDETLAAEPDDAPHDTASEPKQTPTSRKLMTGQIDIDSATGRWIIQEMSDHSDAVIDPTLGEVQLRIREYAEAGSAILPHILSRKA